MKDEQLEVVDEATPEVQETESTPKTFDELTAQRMGKHPIEMSLAEATYFRNLLNKSEFTGSREAYLLIIARAELVSVVDFLNSLDKSKRHAIELTSATIESLNYFVEKKSGVGPDSAQKLFSASMMLRPTVLKLQALDEEIQKLHNS